MCFFTGGYLLKSSDNSSKLKIKDERKLIGKGSSEHREKGDKLTNQNPLIPTGGGCSPFCLENEGRRHPFFYKKWKVSREWGDSHPARDEKESINP